MKDWRALRWIYHVRVRPPAGAERAERVYAPESLAREGFVHGSFAPRVRESAALYFPAGVELEVLRLDPRTLRCRVDYAATPRGVMPHVHGPIAMRAVRSLRPLREFDERVDRVRGGFVAGYRRGDRRG